MPNLLGVAFWGGTRYAQPLNPTHAKKFAALSTLGNLYVVGFSENWQFQQFTEQAHFYLLPQFPWSVLRYVTLLIGGWAIALWLIWQHQVRVFVAQSPYEAVAAAWAKQIANWFGCKVVLVVESHGDFEASLFLQRSVRLPSACRWLMRCAARFSLSQADLLRSVSEATSQQLRQWSPNQPIFKFAAWTDIEAFLQAYPTRSSTPSQTVLYAGVLVPGKGVLHLVNAFAQIVTDFPHANLVMVGREANVAYAASLRQQVQQLGLDDRVQFLSHKPQAELAQQMAQALVFVLPTLSEGLGLVVVEAMATGTPVIASAVGGIPEMIQDGSNGFLIPPEAEMVLTDRLRWCLTHPAEARAMGDRAHQFAQQFFSCSMHVEGYRQVFDAADAILHDRRSVDHAPSPF